MTKQEYEETLKSILPGLPQTNFPVAFEYKTVNQKEVANIRLDDMWFEYDYLDGDADDFKLRFLTTFYWAIARAVRYG